MHRMVLAQESIDQADWLSLELVKATHFCQSHSFCDLEATGEVVETILHLPHVDEIGRGD
jgi:hypothetical protein